MKKEIKMFLGLAALLVATLGVNSIAQYDRAILPVRGTYIQVRKVSSSSSTATALFPVDQKRLDSMCRVNGNYTVWIGTVSGSYPVGTVHDNITQGFFLLSSDTFRMDGQLPGIQYFTCDSNVAYCEIRCLDGMVQ